MALTGMPFAKPERLSGGVSTALGSAVLEWLLILFLFIDAIFSYLITKFARFCGLQTPCLFCSRLDHVLGKEKAGYCWDLICSGHKSEISSLVLCRVHDKLVKVHGMCESCLFSFAATNKSNAETYRLLVGVIINKAHDQKKGRNKPSASVRATNLGNSELDPLSHIGYMELKIASDSEFEVPFSDEDDKNASTRETGDTKEDLTVESVQMVARIIDLGDDLASEKLIDLTNAPTTSLLESDVQLDFMDIHSSTSVAANVETRHGLEELNWQQVESKDIGPAPTELISLDNVPPSLNGAEAPLPTELMSHDDIPPSSNGTEASLPTELISHDDIPPPLNVTEAPLPNEFISHDIHPSLNGTEAPLPTEHISFDDIPPSNRTEAPREVSKELLNKLSTGDVGSTSRKRSTSECEEISKAGINLTTISERASETNYVSSDICNQVLNTLDLGDAYKLAVSNRGRQLSATLTEQWLGKDSSKVSEDLKLLLSELSATRGTEQSVNDISPRLSLNRDDVKSSDANSTGMQMFQKRISLERNESGLSLDGSIVSDIEGESVVDRLKRQIEHDKKLINALYKELEEERNASAVAANQTMAMITRLQEEKATLQMEALQYLRMMDEQSEYDMEELLKANDLLAEKEKEIQDLEGELEFYHQKFPNELMLENLVKTNSDRKVRDIGMDHVASACNESDANVLSDSVAGRDTGSVKNALLEFEDERLYLLQHLKKLEKQISPFLCNSRSLDSSEQSPNERRDQVNEPTELISNGGSQQDSEKEEADLSKQDAYPLPSCNLQVPLFEKPLTIKGNGGLDCSGQSTAVLGADLASIGSLVCNFDKRLQALEEDSNFLEHTVNLLRIREEGLQFIQEIANHLRELRKIEILRKDQSDA
ncbi:myosin-binding protein 1-like [Quillaja saponaria]|uniref:Myosin-binding protein 1-like n=1 Tax=Quillaja saponaria TaxID=32244 RepID=A0AAD7VF92_QUISA|nr:myosin-binding protein 1-like [Quillaja saponaria]